MTAIRHSTPPRPAATLFTPIAADLEEAERVLGRGPGELPHAIGAAGRSPAALSRQAAAAGAAATDRAGLRPGHAGPPPPGAVVEMIHTATLVHDDVLDEAELRRHVPTVNAGWGNKTAILLGDMLFTHAFHLTSTIGDAPGLPAHRRGDEPRLCRRTAPDAASAATST